MKQTFFEAVENNPIIAAVKNTEDLDVCCNLEDIQVVFILFGDICSIREIVHRVKESGKIAMVHVDLVGGLSPRDIAVDYLKNNTETDGIITTKPSLIKRAKELSMYTVHSSSTVCGRILLKFFREQCQRSFRDCVKRSGYP